MNKLFFSVFIILIWGSCTLSEPDDTLIINHSTDKVITVKFLHTDNISLNPGESLHIKTITSVNPSRSVEYYSPDKRVFYEYSLLQFDFYDRDSYEISILNLTGKAGILKADGWIDDIEFDETNIIQSNNNWLLYNQSPKFSAVTIDGFPLTVIFLKEGSAFKVTIN